MKKILGLDLGTTSIGWALVEQDFENRIGKFIGLGSRIIPTDVELLSRYNSGLPLSKAKAGQAYTAAGKRTDYRGKRRLRERQLLRRERLHRVLNILDYLPGHYKNEIDFEKNYGKFLVEKEPRIAYEKINNKYDFIFKESFNEMLQDFKLNQPELLKNKNGEPALIPYDWTIYYIRKKALVEKIDKYELAWIILNFNQKRGYYQLRGEEDEIDSTELKTFEVLKVAEVKDTGETIKGKDIKLYDVYFENGWKYDRQIAKVEEWIGKTKEFIVTTSTLTSGEIKRSFKAVDSEKDWIAIKQKTEQDIINTNESVGSYIYNALLANPNQKIKGKLIRTIERKFYKDELKKILNKQKEFHTELLNSEIYKKCLNELYKMNESHVDNNINKDFTYLFVDDIIFYQRPLKSKKSLISNCPFEERIYIQDDKKITDSIKCIAKSNPYYQEFRLWQFLKNLKIYEKKKIVDGKLKIDYDITDELLKNEDDWADLFNWLNDRKEIDQKAFLKYPKFNIKKNIENYRWNYVEDKPYPCNETRSKIKAKFKNVENIEDNFLELNELKLWHILYSIENKEELKNALKSFASKNNLGNDFIKNFLKIAPFEKDYGAYSEKAIKKLLPLMRRGKYWNQKDIKPEIINRLKAILERLENIDYDETKINDMSDDDIPKQILKSFIKTKDNLFGLNTYQACYLIYNRFSEKSDVIKWKNPKEIDKFLNEEFKQHSLRNPIVEQVISETLRIVKDIWVQYGNSEKDYFDEIHIELAREMKNPTEVRENITKKNIENEKTNQRIRALLFELFNDKDIENVRPHSPNQVELLKIFEEGVLISQKELPEEIEKILKSKNPTTSELIKYKLWIAQKYRSPYTGKIIPLSKLFTPAFEIEHIIPQSRYFDDSLSNKVICEAEINKDKNNQLAYEYIKKSSGKKTLNLFTIQEYEEFVKTNFNKNISKMKKLLLEDIPDTIIERQLNDTRYISKIVKNLLSNIVREDSETDVTSKRVIPLNGTITSILKQDWGLNQIWNELITPRFERLNELTSSNKYGSYVDKQGKRVFEIDIPMEESKGFRKKRIDHRHHALDALVVACTTRNHVGYLNNEYAHKDKSEIRFDLRNKLRRVEEYMKDGKKYKSAKEFIKPWDTFTQETKEQLENIIVSFKQNIRILNRSVNYYDKLIKTSNGGIKKVKVKQETENWVVRKPLHQDTVAGKVKLKFIKNVRLSVALENWEMIVDKKFKNEIKKMFQSGLDKEKIIKQFKNEKNIWNDKEISKLDIYYYDEEYAATRKYLDDSFDSKQIAKITDSGIRKILINHLKKYDEIENGKIVEHPEIAFSPDGIDELNKNIVNLNNGKKHKEIRKVRVYETLGNKFSVGYNGNKKSKFVNTASGTNLFYAIYVNDEGKRNYVTVPLNIVIDRMKAKLTPVPEVDENNNKLLFFLSPDDLVYIPKEPFDDKKETRIFTKEDKQRIYRTEKVSGSESYFIRHDIASLIKQYDSKTKVGEFESQNKLQTTMTKDKKKISEYCLKLEVDRLGNIKKIIG